MILRYWVTIIAKRTRTRTYYTPIRLPVVARGLGEYYNGAIPRIVTPADSRITRMKMFVSSEVIGQSWHHPSPPIPTGIWQGATRRRGIIIRTRTFTSKRTRSIEISLTRRSRRFTYRGWRPERGWPTSKSVDRWTITPTGLVPRVWIKKKGRPAWELIEALVRRQPDEWTAEASLIFLVPPVPVWRPGKWVKDEKRFFIDRLSFVISLLLFTGYARYGRRPEYRLRTRRHRRSWRGWRVEILHPTKARQGWRVIHDTDSQISKRSWTQRTWF